MMAEPEAHRDPLAMQQFFCRIWRNDHALCAVDAGGICCLADAANRSPELRDVETGFL
ncbi:hypothetical protein ACP0HM_33330 [Escherichia coli]